MGSFLILFVYFKHNILLQLGAFQVPSLRKEIDLLRLKADKIHLSYNQLEDELINERIQHETIVEREKIRSKADIISLTEQHQNTIAQSKYKHLELERVLSLLHF